MNGADVVRLHRAAERLRNVLRRVRYPAAGRRREGDEDCGCQSCDCHIVILRPAGCECRIQASDPTIVRTADRRDRAAPTCRARSRCSCSPARTSGSNGMSCALVYCHTSFVVQAASGLSFVMLRPEGNLNGSTLGEVRARRRLLTPQAGEPEVVPFERREQRLDLVLRAARVRARLPQARSGLGRAQVDQIQMPAPWPVRRDRRRSARSGAPCRGRAPESPGSPRAACGAPRRLRLESCT